MDKSNDKYKELLDAILKRQILLLDEKVAVQHARAVPGLEVTDEGEVMSIKGDPVEVVRGLVEQFNLYSGSVGVLFCKQAAEPILEKYPDLKVPKEIAR